MHRHTFHPFIRTVAPLWILFIVVAWVRAQCTAAPLQHETGSEADLHAALPAAEFGRIVREFSEDGGYFHSDNFVSNETSYLSVVGKMRELEISGGAYIGVGPEQNFTYIARIRPRIAFIVDIRRQAVLQHLMYKALFQLSDTRSEFLARLFSRPLPEEAAFAGGASIQDLMEYFARAPADSQAYSRNLAEIESIIRTGFDCPLTEEDEKTLDHVYGHFREAGPGVSYWAVRMSFLPSLKDLIEQQEADGRLGNFLADEEDYAFVRDLQRRNLIIPVVGDFSGSKALLMIADYLRRNSYEVTAFYTSNVEEYLFLRGVFARFVQNLKAMPAAPRAVLIRADPSGWRLDPPAPISRTVMQSLPLFLTDYERGFYSNFLMLFDNDRLFANPRPSGH
jgi:hypothetical protein